MKTKPKTSETEQVCERELAKRRNAVSDKVGANVFGRLRVIEMRLEVEDWAGATKDLRSLTRFVSRME